jgi:hypothetical protein
MMRLLDYLSEVFIVTFGIKRVSLALCNYGGDNLWRGCKYKPHILRLSSNREA